VSLGVAERTAASGGLSCGLAGGPHTKTDATIAVAKTWGVPISPRTKENDYTDDVRRPGVVSRSQRIECLGVTGIHAFIENYCT
jgi:hypothetical protein